MKTIVQRFVETYILFIGIFYAWASFANDDLPSGEEDRSPKRVTHQASAGQKSSTDILRLPPEIQKHLIDGGE